MKQSPGVVLKSKFVMPGADEFKEYINYISREETTYKREIEFQNDEKGNEIFSVYYSYMDYMGDEEKQGALFTSDQDRLSETEKNELKELFHRAQSKGSPLWQDVISFDNNWLLKYGVMDKKTGALDETKIKNVVRAAVGDMLQAEHMEDTAVWSAAIHFNTDNIHVHIATVEPIPTRVKKKVLNTETGQWEEQYRAKRKQSSLDKMKSKVANLVMDRTAERNQVTDLIRGSVQLKKEQKIDLSTYRKTRKLFKQALEHLPADRSQWQYGYQSVDDARPYIDEIVDIYLGHYYKKETKELHRLLDEEVEVMKEMYGEGSNYQDYKKTKLDDIKKRMGNAVLTEMRVFQKNKDNRLYEQANYRGISLFQRKITAAGDLNRALNNLNYRMRKTHEEYQKDRNLAEFDRMLDGYDR
ncbi:MAG: MobP2 family relaxase [Carnobacterium sp.]|uniref:MobP2 family relaxase n=1 Tax=Carnobacterium sp. TaxID=48221 RepID=UPI002FC83D73